MNQTIIARRVLREDIVAGRWQPNKKLAVRELCDTYDLASSSIREALSTLAGEGLVLALENRGFRVTPLSRQDLEDIEWMRVQVETAALKRSMSKGDRDWEAGVVAALYHLTESTRVTGTDRESLDQWNRQHDAFHRALITSCGSLRALELQQRLANQHRRYRIALMNENMRRVEIVDEHKAIADAVLRRDEDEAVHLLESNLHTTTEFYAEQLVSLEQPLVEGSGQSTRTRRRRRHRD